MERYLTYITSIPSKFFHYMSKERLLKGASLLRIGLGLIIFYNYIIHYSQRQVLFSTDGILGEFRLPLTLYGLVDSMIYFEIVYHMGILFSILFIVGFKGKTVGIINYILTFSFIQQGYLMSDGGDNLMALLLFYLLFANTTAYYSLDAAKFREKKREYENRYSYKTRIVIHNFAIITCIIQVCVVYLVSGLYQVMGDMWNNGTAIYYIMQVDVFANPLLNELIVANEYLMVIFTYASILIKIAFPFLLFNRVTKYIAMACLITFHIGIGVSMGLITFSLVMILAELLIITDREYTSFFYFFNKLKKSMAIRFKNAIQPRLQETPLVKTNKIVVLYDGWCPLCIQSVKKLRKYDWLNIVEFKSFRLEDNFEQYNIGLNRLEKRMHSFNNKDEYKEGIDAFIQIVTRMPLLWLLLPFLYLGRILGLGQFMYDYIASKRNIIPSGQCDLEGCDIQYKSDRK